MRLHESATVTGTATVIAEAVPEVRKKQVPVLPLLLCVGTQKIFLCQCCVPVSTDSLQAWQKQFEDECMNGSVLEAREHSII